MKVDRNRRVLCFASYYLPGLKSGGPLRSLLHLQEWLRDDYEFRVITRNRDLGVHSLYEGLDTGRWYPVQETKVWYLAAPHPSPISMRKAVLDAEPDLLYFHSSLDPFLAIMPLMLRRLGFLPRDIPVLVAPRGEFSAGARSLKYLKKRIFLFAAKALGLYRNVTWHATANEEAEEIRALWGANVPVVIAQNLPSKVAADLELHRQSKQPGTLRLVFLSRISRKKNLHGALDILRGVKARVQFDIYGAREDPKYWDECSQLINELPGNIEARYKGVLSPDDVIPVLSGYDAFLLPTLGENFGHVIHEALLAGCPVLLSDQTPWRNLAAGKIGFDIPLDQPQRFQQAIEQFSAMDGSEFDRWSACARACGLSYSNNAEIVRCTRSMLAEVIRR